MGLNSGFLSRFPLYPLCLMLPLSSVGLQKAGHRTGSRRTGEEKQKPKVIIGFLPEKVSGESDLASLPHHGGA